MQIAADMPTTIFVDITTIRAHEDGCKDALDQPRHDRARRITHDEVIFSCLVQSMGLFEIALLAMMFKVDAMAGAMLKMMMLSLHDTFLPQASPRSCYTRLIRSRQAGQRQKIGHRAQCQRACRRGWRRGTPAKR